MCHIVDVLAERDNRRPEDILDLVHRCLVHLSHLREALRLRHGLEPVPCGHSLGSLPRPTVWPSEVRRDASVLASFGMVIVYFGS